MPSSTILSDNGASSGTSGIKTSGGNDGLLLLQTTTSGGTATTAVTIDTSQNTTLAGTLTHPLGSASTPSITFTGDTNTGIYSSGADTVIVVTGGTAAQTIDSGQRTKFPTTIGVGGATPSTSGAGITFPATQSASTDANTLDDYEEGTWTPALTFGGGSTGITYDTQNGSYVKIGKQVTCVGVIFLTNKGSSTGNADIRGLPFTVASGEPNYGGVCFNYIESVTFADIILGRTVAGDTRFVLTETTNAGVATTITNSDFVNTSLLRFTVTYFV